MNETFANSARLAWFPTKGPGLFRVLIVVVALLGGLALVWVATSSPVALASLVGAALLVCIGFVGVGLAIAGQTPQWIRVDGEGFTAGGGAYGTKGVRVPFAAVTGFSDAWSDWFAIHPRYQRPASFEAAAVRVDSLVPLPKPFLGWNFESSTIYLTSNNRARLEAAWRSWVGKQPATLAQ